MCKTSKSNWNSTGDEESEEEAEESDEEAEESDEEAAAPKRGGRKRPAGSFFRYFLPDEEGGPPMQSIGHATRAVSSQPA
jgi:hypothetical protein